MKQLLGIKKVFSSLFLIVLFHGFIPAVSLAGGSWNGWIYQDPYPTSVNLFDVKFVTPVKGWITGKYGSIFYTEDGGNTWESQESGIEEDIMRVAFVNDKMGWAAGERGTIIHTEDGGKKWITQYNIKALPTKIFFIDEKEGWVTGSTPIGVVFHTLDSGRNWQKVETGIGRAISSVYFINSQIGWILAGEDIYRTIDGGRKWEKSTLPANVPSAGPRPLGTGPTAGTFGISPVQGLGPEWWFGGIAFENERQGWAVTSRWIFHTDNGGKTWIIQFDTGSLDRGLRHISFKDAQNGCASGWSVYCTEDGGKTWQERLGLEPGHDKELGGVVLNGRSDGWVVGNDGQILKTENNGRTWKKAFKKNECGSEVFFLNKKTGWIYDSEKFNSFCKTNDGGQVVEKQNIGIRVMNVFFLDNLTGWIVGIIDEWREGDKTHRRHNRINVWGVIKHTSDGGKTWTTQYKESLGKNDNPHLKAISFVNRETGWVVGSKGIILHTDDGGIHWEHQKGRPDNYFLSKIYFIEPKKGWITGTQSTDYWTGIIIYTEDGGKHWSVQRSQRNVAFDDSQFINEKIGWVSGYTEWGEVGVVLHTDNGGKIWAEKRFETIGFNRMAFIDKEQGAIYSLDTGLMLITTDGGKIWEKRRSPLKKNPWHISEIFEQR